VTENKIVTSRENPHVKRLDALLRQKKAREESGLFVLEGARLCLDAVQSGLSIECVYLTRESAEKTPALLNLAEAAGQTVWLSESLAGRLGETKTPQGVFAVLPACALPRLGNPKPDGRYLLLYQVRDPGNLGGILRTAAALGGDGAYLCDCAEHVSPKVLRASMGGIFRLPLAVVDDMAALVARLSNVGVQTFAAAGGGTTAPQVLAGQGGKAVLIGNEGNGLPDDLTAACTATVSIPMKTGNESLNAAMAAGILMWEMIKDS